MAPRGPLSAIKGRPETPAAPARVVIPPKPRWYPEDAKRKGPCNRMLRAQVPTGQDLGRRRLDGHEALPLQALEHRERRRQRFTALAVMPASVRDRDLDEGGQELGRCLSVTRFQI